MVVVDANLLIYAYNTDAEQHGRSLHWLRGQLQGSEAVRLPWIAVLAFLRISTGKVLPHPLTRLEAITAVGDWLGSPAAAALGPGPAHWDCLAEVIRSAGVTGNDMTDAHLAALTIEHGGVLHTTDRGFARFPGLRWRNPLAD